MKISDTQLESATNSIPEETNAVVVFVKTINIRVKVVEARQLQGNNIPPVCKIICAGSQKETKVKSQTNSPYWDETFYFNFYEAAATLLEKPIVFGVYHSKKMRKDALIGSFKFDLGLVYDQDKHALLNKWLLLCDPDDTMSGCKGYLKVSVVIVGPGDEPPVPTEEPPQAMHE
ncbi:FerI domain protein [Opisthorchis viverrini]|uniref:FerI domain protein n=1 Tax=Opisthorchis viverrini TaxID=6198 RepID=A0A1S8WUE1_OPIVI|nr:FerI domain protein [Opisthorchis viverrini]